MFESYHAVDLIESCLNIETLKGTIEGSGSKKKNIIYEMEITFHLLLPLPYLDDHFLLSIFLLLLFAPCR